MSVDLVRRETSVLFSMAEYIHMFCSLEGADARTLKRQMFGAAGIFIEKCYNKNICINRWTLLAYLICFSTVWTNSVQKEDHSRSLSTLQKMKQSGQKK